MARGPRSALMSTSQENARMRTTPIPVRRSSRGLNFRALTTIPAGWITPLLGFGLLREDALTSCQLSLGFELYETAELLANPVLLNVRAYLIPNLAFERFNGSIDTLNRSYTGQVEPGVGGTVVPWFNSSTNAPGPQGGSANEVLYYMGAHVPEGGSYNTAYNEAYNIMVGHRYINRSPELKSLVPASNNQKLFRAMWRHPDLGHIVPDFDQATLDGEVPLNLTPQSLLVRGIGMVGPATAMNTALQLRESNLTTTTGNGWAIASTQETAAANQTSIGISARDPNHPLIYAELQGENAFISLADINTAQRARSFAALRKAYAGYDDEYIKDLLMGGIRMPTEAEKQPILLANVMTAFGQGKRYATDSTDLTASVSSGATTVSMRLRSPPVNTGGVVIVTAELYPEQLWERREDTYLTGLNLAGVARNEFPEYVRDTLDPERVDVVKCGRVDVRHSTPTATFGYEPLHARWQTFPPRVGGKFYRPEVDLPADEDRARIWASETVDPTLSADFYLVTNLHTKPFVVTDQDPSETLLRGSALITGNTVFGLPLIESGDEYTDVMEQAPLDRIDKEDLTPLGDEAEEGEAEEENK